MKVIRVILGFTVLMIWCLLASMYYFWEMVNKRKFSIYDIT